MKTTLKTFEETQTRPKHVYQGLTGDWWWWWWLL